MALQWYVARTTPRGECAARDALESGGFEVFMPCVHAHLPQRSYTDMPLFPGYLFLHYDLDERGAYPLRAVPQLRGLVAFGGVVPPVPDMVIAELATRVETINGDGGLWRRLEPGDRVSMVVGRTRTFAQVVAQMKSPRAMVQVLLDFLGRQVRAEVHPDSLELVGVGLRAQLAHDRPPRRTRGKQRWIRGHGQQALASP